MAIIIISRGSFTWGKEIAEATAKRLGYKCVSREDILRVSDEFNIPEIELAQAIERPLSVFERFMREKRMRYLSFLQTAILRCVQEDNVVGHGFLGHLLVKDVPHLLAVRINADLEDRVKIAQERDGMARGEAFRFLKKLDAQRKKWARQMFGVDVDDSSLYDVVLQLRKLTLDDAVDVICSTARSNRFVATTESQSFLDDLLLASEVKTALLDSRPDVRVSAKAGHVLVEAVDDGSDEEEITEHICGIAQKIKGVTRLEISVVPATR